MAAQFHSMPFAKFPNPGVSGDLYYATDRQELYLCASGAMFAMSGVLNGGISLDSVGPQGPVGSTGPQGSAGATGPQGPQGPQGGTGATGSQGVQGTAGSVGPAGRDGSKGDKGDSGPAGPLGPVGPQGSPGVQGDDGEDGAQGVTGRTGDKGQDGATGPQGQRGATGSAGPTGSQGPTGAAAPARVATIQIVIDGTGSVPSTGPWGFFIVPFACTVTGWSVVGDTSGSAVIDVLKTSYSSFPSGFASIAGSDKPTLSGAQKNENLSVSAWTVPLAAQDVLKFNLDSVATCTRLNLSITVSIP